MKANIDDEWGKVACANLELPTLAERLPAGPPTPRVGPCCLEVWMVGGRYGRMKGLTSTTVFGAQLQTSLYCFLSQLTLAFIDPGRFPGSQIQELVGFDDHSWAKKAGS